MVRLFAVALMTVVLMTMAGVVRADPASAPGEPQTVEPIAEPEVAATSAEVFVYAARGQSDKQLDRDRYECHKWSVTQTGYDPSAHAQPVTYQPTPVVRLPPRGIDTVAGVISGAFTGAVLAGPYDTSEGAMIGAIAGGIMGAITESARRKEAGQINAHQGAQSQAERARLESSVSNYRRAISACLEGRGYTVK
jgi:hypothetical protein